MPSRFVSQRSHWIRSPLAYLSLVALSGALVACSSAPPPAPTSAPAKPAAPAATAAPAAAAPAAPAPAAPAAAAPAAASPAAAPAAKPAAAAPANLPPLRVVGGPAGQWPNHLPMVVGDHEGFFKEAGFNSVTFTKAGGDGNALAALIGGQADISVATSTESVALLVEKGEKLFIIGSTSNNNPLSMIGAKTITKMTELKGKKVATNQEAGTVDGYIEKALVRNGLALSDVQLVRLGADNERYAALDNGLVDAAVIGPLLKAKAVQQGYQNLFRLGDLYPEYLQRVYVASGDFLDKQPASVDAYMVAIVRGHDYLHNTANIPKVGQYLEQDKYQVEQEFLENTIKEQLTLLPRNALPSAAGAQIVLDEIKKDAPSVTPDKLLRLGPVQKAIQQTGVKPS